MKGAKLSWNMKRGGRSDDTLDSGMGTLQPHGTGPRLESLLMDTIIGRGIRLNYQARSIHFGPVGPQQVIQAIIVQLQSDVYTLKMAPPVQPNLVTRPQPLSAPVS